MKLGRFDISGSYVGDCRDLLRELPDGCVQTCVTSPPYWGLRDYGVEGQIGLEASPRAYVDEMVRVFEEVRRVLRDDGTLWLNLGDSYASAAKGQGGMNSTTIGSGKGQSTNVGSVYGTRHFDLESFGVKSKDLVGIPWLAAFALRDAGWYLRSDIIWSKPNPMPESVTDRPTKAHEYLFLMSKSERYYYDADAIAEPAVKGAGGSTFVAGKTGANGLGRVGLGERIDAETRNKRSVWTVATQPYDGAHFATFPPALIAPCILAGSRPGDVVLDPFFGSGTTGKVAEDNGRLWLGFDLNPAYHELQKKRTAQRGLCFAPVREGGG